MDMFDWRHHLDFARTLVSSPLEGSEASHRAAASRAYYAAFHKAREGVGERNASDVWPRCDSRRGHPPAEGTRTVAERGPER